MDKGEQMTCGAPLPATEWSRQTIGDVIGALRQRAPDAGLDASDGLLAERIIGAALREVRRAESGREWVYLRIPCESDAVRSFVAGRLRSFVAAATGRYAIDQWWWLHKVDADGSHVRLRLLVPGAPEWIGATLRSDADGALGVSTLLLVYEPEIAFFGGVAGMEWAHNFFFADSEFLATWFAETTTTIKADLGVSVALCSHLLRMAGLDPHEQWDVWKRVQRFRHPRGAIQPSSDVSVEWARRIVGANATQLLRTVEGVPRSLLATHLERLTTLGKELHLAAARGSLECGLRHTLAGALIFHWNRLGAPFRVQSGLSNAVVRALDPTS